MESLQLSNLTLKKDFKWLNAPSNSRCAGNSIAVTTKYKTDLWQETWYNFRVNTGHIFGVEIEQDFIFELCVDGQNCKTQYDQAGLIIYKDETHWLKAGLEYNDGELMISSVLTNEVSDWATGTVLTNPSSKLQLRLTKLGNVVSVKYCENNKWRLLRLCQFSTTGSFLVGLMCCSPKRDGLQVTFTDINFRTPIIDILNSSC